MICTMMPWVVTNLGFVAIMGEFRASLHKMEAHYVPVLSSPQASRAVAEATSATSPAPARKNQGSWRNQNGETTMKVRLFLCTCLRSLIPHHFGHSPLGSIISRMEFVLPSKTKMR